MAIREETVPDDLQNEFLSRAHQYIITVKQGGVFWDFPIL